MSIQGLYDKYQVRRLDDSDGRHLDCRFFVLDPQHDPAAQVALAAYADQVGEAGDEALKVALVRWLNDLRGAK